MSSASSVGQSRVAQHDRARQSQVLRLKRYLDSSSFGGVDSDSRSSIDAEAHHGAVHICRQPRTFFRSSPLFHSLLEGNLHLPTIDNNRIVPSSVAALLQSATDDWSSGASSGSMELHHGTVQQAVGGPAVAEHCFRLFASNFRVLFLSQRLSHPRQRLHLPSRRIENERWATTACLQRFGHHGTFESVLS